MRKPNLPIQGQFLARNTALNLFGQGIPFLVALLSIPFLIHRLGPSRFGILSLAWAVVGYFTLFDLGLGRAATKHVAAALGSGGELRVPSLAWTAVVAQALLGLLGCAALASLTPLLVGRVFNIPQELSAEARRSLFVLALSIPTTLMVGSLRGVLEAAQRFDLVNAVRAPLGSANFLLPCAGAFLGWDVPKIIGLLVFSSCVALVIYYRLCVHVFPSLKARPQFSRSEILRLIKFGGWVMVSSIVGPILVYLDRFMVATFLSIEAVGYYSAPYEMVTRLWIVPASLGATLFPAFSTMSALQETSSLKRLVPRSIGYLLLLLGPVIVVLVVFAPDILQIWLGAGFAKRSATVLPILALGVLLNSLAQVPYALIQGFDRPDLTAKLHLVEVPLHVALAWILVVHLGLTGAALAWSIRVAFDTVMLFWVASRLTQLPSRIFMSGEILHTITILAFLGCAAAIIANLLSIWWIKLLVLACLLGLGGVALWRYSLDQGDRSWIGTLVRTTQSGRLLSSRQTRSR